MKIIRGRNSQIFDLDAHIGRCVRQYRILKGYNQQELGSKLGLSLQQIQKYENGNNRISAGTLILIASIMNLNIEQFLSPKLLWGEQALGNKAYCTQKNHVGDGRTQRYQLEIVRALGEINSIHLSKALLKLIRCLNAEPGFYDKQIK